MDVYKPMANHTDESEAKQQEILVEWLHNILPNLSLPDGASVEELRACLIDGTVLCRILSRLRPGSFNEGGDSDYPPASRLENIKRFLATMDDLGVPKFEISDLEKGSMKTVIDCLLKLRAQFSLVGDNFSVSSTTIKFGSLNGDVYSRGVLSPLSGVERQKVISESRFQRALRSPIMSAPSASLVHQVRNNIHDVFEIKNGSYADLPPAKITEMMNSNSLDNAPTQSLLSVVNGILEESVERKNGEIPHRVACLLRKAVQEIERRISTQADHLRTQNNLFKAREEKYQSRIKVLEALASGTGKETGIDNNQLQQMKIEKSKMEERKKLEEEYAVRLIKEKDTSNLEISTLKQELEMAKKTYELRCLQVETESNSSKSDLEKRIKELEHRLAEPSNRVKELENLLEESRNRVKELENLLAESRNRVKELEAYELRCSEVEAESKSSKSDLDKRIKELENLLAESRNKVKEVESYSESKYQKWSKKENSYKSFMDFQFCSLRELRVSSGFIKQEVLKTQMSYSEEFNHLGEKLKALAYAAENYHEVLDENRKLFNEIQDLKGNIRVCCRIRPFLPWQTAKRSTIEYIGENGELVVANPSKPGKDGNRLFKFNKVFGPDATQVDVFSDIQPLIRSALDGYNVCIFAYGQTGSGKTYTMTGPDGASNEQMGVNYRSLNDLFHNSQLRNNSIKYEVGVQMVEIYNEQVRDLLSGDGSQKKLGILSTAQPNGLAIPDASMHPVSSTSDVLDLMDVGMKNRASGATALNERSSRSHSVLTIHVRGKDLKTGVPLHGNLHLVDLAGSERVDRSEVTGERLKEAQHINKSLSALGDVIFALAQKSSHVPYRNSKLTQVLQSSLGGQAKTLMFVQLNPDATSFSETMSTLKFAERVSAVELGAARSSKEGRDVRELMEQVASLKNTVAKKDDEIERLQLLKDLKNVYSGINGEKNGPSSMRYESSSPSRGYGGDSPERNQKSSAGKGFGCTEKAASDHDNRSEYSDKNSKADSQKSMDDYKHKNELPQKSKVGGSRNFPADGEILGFGDADHEERLSDVSDSCLSAGTDPDGSVDDTNPTDGRKLSNQLQRPRSASKLQRPLQRSGQTSSTASKDHLKVSKSIRRSDSSSTLLKPPRRWT
ncbi:kinesin-like protein KIN-14P isoform X1 [Tripterygium wilfordii]|uniref:kinesin-like protein KIN-14P isoform X1 n=1 Tax=Tripterygium wilfordii TaxID=458696 RepID=UPI0018F818D2|nr:kinesin-like protein KIN-14P isoform X1 [Tripterygium wilfordii]